MSNHKKQKSVWKKIFFFFFFFFFFFRIETVAGTATPGSDYKPINEIIHFKENEMLEQIYIEIIDDFEWEPDEFFFVQLVLLSDNQVSLGKNHIMQVTIINDDGKLFYFVFLPYCTSENKV